MQCASTETMDQYMPLVGIPNILPMDAAGMANASASDAQEAIYYFATLSPSQVRLHGPGQRAGHAGGPVQGGD